MAKKANDTVTIKLPKAARDQADFITASVNGKTYKIMRGVPVEVPRSLAEVIRNSEAAEAAADAFVAIQKDK